MTLVAVPAVFDNVRFNVVGGVNPPSAVSVDVPFGTFGVTGTSPVDANQIELAG